MSESVHRKAEKLRNRADAMESLASKFPNLRNEPGEHDSWQYDDLVTPDVNGLDFDIHVHMASFLSDELVAEGRFRYEGFVIMPDPPSVVIGRYLGMRWPEDAEHYEIWYDYRQRVLDARGNAGAVAKTVAEIDRKENDCDYDIAFVEPPR